MQSVFAPLAILKIVCSALGWAQDEVGFAVDPILMGGIAIGFVLLLLLAGVVIWRTMFATNQTDFSSKYRENEAVDSAPRSASGQGMLDRDAVSKSADTVSSKTDDALIDPLRKRPLAHPTVDAMSDLSVSSEDEDENDED
jgi:hypothetical protein